MNIRIPCIASEEAGTLINRVSIDFEEKIRTELVKKDYGAEIEQFTVFFVSVFSDSIENSLRCPKHPRPAHFKDYFTGRRIKYIAVSIPINPDDVLLASENALTILLKNALLDKLLASRGTVSKKFNWTALYEDIKIALS